MPCQGKEAIGECISQVYTVSLSLVGIVAFVQIVYGGFMLLTAAGNTSKTGQAMDKIKNAVLGIVLLFSSYLILNTINPDLVNFNFAFKDKLAGEELVGPNQLSEIRSFNVTPNAVKYSEDPPLNFTFRVYASKNGLGAQCPSGADNLRRGIWLKMPPVDDILVDNRTAGNKSLYGEGKVLPFDLTKKLQEVVHSNPGVVPPTSGNLQFYGTFSCGTKELNRSAPITINMTP